MRKTISGCAHPLIALPARSSFTGRLKVWHRHHDQLPCHRTWFAFEGTHNIRCDPAAVKLPGLGYHNPAVHSAPVNLVGVKGEKAGDGSIPGGWVRIAPGGGFDVTVTEEVRGDGLNDPLIFVVHCPVDRLDYPHGPDREAVPGRRVMHCGFVANSLYELASHPGV